MSVSSDSTYYESVHGQYVISTDPARLDTHAIHAYLTDAYWARGRTLDTVIRSLRHSLCFGLYACVQPLDEQIGFARLITDYTIFAYLCDVYILDAHRGHGLGTWLIESVLGHPELQTVRRWTLVTNDAHEFYAPQGFTALRDPSKHMERIHAAVADAAARDNTT